MSCAELPGSQQRNDFLKSQQAAIQQRWTISNPERLFRSIDPLRSVSVFQTAIQLLKGLQSDFRAVEERFQEIARDVQKLQSSGDDSRGRILGFALDAEDMLKQQDEGISFYAFAKFLLSPTQQNAVRKNIEEIQKLTALADQQDSLYRLRRMVPQCCGSGQSHANHRSPLGNPTSLAGCAGRRASHADLPRSFKTFGRLH